MQLGTLVEYLVQSGHHVSHQGQATEAIYAVQPIAPERPPLAGVLYVGSEACARTQVPAKVPLLMVSEPDELAPVLHAAQARLLTHLQRSDCLTRLYAAMLTKQEPDTLLGLASAAMGHALFWLDRDCQTLADSLSGATPDQANALRGMVMSALRHIPSLPELASPAGGARQVHVPGMTCPLWLITEDNQAGHLVVVEQDGLLVREDLGIAQGVFKKLLADLPDSRREAEIPTVSTAPQLLRRLLRGEAIPPETARRVFKGPWREAEQRYHVLAIDCSASAVKMDHKAVKAALEQRLGVPLVAWGAFWVGLLTCHRETNLKSTDFPALLDSLQEYDLRAGLSFGYTELAATSRFFRQSVSSIDLGVHYERPQRFTRYEDYVISHILEVCNAQIDLHDLCHPIAVTIRQHDLDNGTDYIRTLYAYLRCGRSIQLASELLHIHRNTMYHRMARIRDLFDINFDDFSLVLKLMISMQVYAYSRVFDVQIW